MSAKYRIEVEHKPQDRFPWKATAYTVDDDRFTGITSVDETSMGVVEDITRKLAAVGTAEEPTTFYADASGKIVPAPVPQSLRA